MKVKEEEVGLVRMPEIDSELGDRQLARVAPDAANLPACRTAGRGYGVGEVVAARGVVDVCEAVTRAPWVVVIVFL